VTPPPDPRDPLRPWLRSLAAHAAVLLLVAGAVWVIIQVFLRLQVVALTVLAAILFTALVHPVVRGLRRVGAPAWTASLGAVAFLLLIPVGIGYLVVEQALSQWDDLRGAVTDGVAATRGWLVEGPLSLSPDQVDRVSDALTDAVQGSAPAPVAGAALILELLGATVVAFVLVFFLCKDGRRMWGWVLDRAPAGRRDEVDGAGHAAWETLSHYVGGTALIAVIDAAGIGFGLVLLDVPMALSLTLLIFVGGFIPLLGATVSGAVAVVVALSTQGFPTALMVAAVVIGVQQLEGNLLQPLIMGRAVRLHPAVILVTVSAGFVLGGVAGAAIAVPMVAVSYRVTDYLTDRRAAPGVGRVSGQGTSSARAAGEPCDCESDFPSGHVGGAGSRVRAGELPPPG
jgi:putative heme transporter